MFLHLGLSIEALRGLDSDYRMVARCRDYLEQLVQVVQTLGIWFLPRIRNIYILTIAAVGQGLLAESAEWRTGYGPNDSFDNPNGSGNSGSIPGETVALGNSTFNNRHSPLGMELGEFMLDGDLNFLSSHLFEYNSGGSEGMI